jgi:hypothetical protein
MKRRPEVAQTLRWQDDRGVRVVYHPDSRFIIIIVALKF